MRGLQLNLFDGIVTTRMKYRKRTKFQQFDENGNVYCYKCEQYKPIDCFDYAEQNWYRDCRDRRCKECKKKQREKRLLDNQRIGATIDHMLNLRYLGARERAKRNGLEINISTQYLKELWEKQEGKCALSGVGMTYLTGGGRHFTNVSIDRIDSNKGYVIGNIQLVCMACNQMKSDLTEQEMYDFCKKIVEQYESKNSKNTESV